jgi:hypothetical protein
MNELSSAIAELVCDIQLFNEGLRPYADPRANGELRIALKCLSSAMEVSSMPGDLVSRGLVSDNQTRLMKLFAKAAFHFQGARRIVPPTMVKSYSRITKQNARGAGAWSDRF